MTFHVAFEPQSAVLSLILKLLMSQLVIIRSFGLLLFLPVGVGRGTERCQLEGVGHLVRVTVQLLEQV